jgi:dihydroflavonol-4-reductase
MTALVTGASGHIGANVVRLLLAEKRTVRAAVHANARPLTGLSVEAVSLDIIDRSAAERALAGVDVVYHCAGSIAIRKSDERGMWAANVDGTRQLTEAALDAGVRRFVHFSSIHALSRIPENEPVDERRPLVDRHWPVLYDASKAEGERIVQEAVRRGLDAVIVNPTAVIGPHDYKPSLLGEFLVMLVAGKLPGLVQGGFNWVDARDVAAGALAAEKKGRTGERYILGGTWESVAGLARLVADLTGGRPVKRMISPFFARLGLPFIALGAALAGRRSLYTRDSLETLTHFRHVSSDKAMTELGYRPGALSDTLKDTIAWFGKHGFLPGERTQRND